MNQLDIFDDDPARKAYANRVAADTALHDPHFPSAAEREMRHRHYLQEAARFERLAAANRRNS